MGLNFESKTMKALVENDAEDDTVVADIPLPPVEENEVLVKVDHVTLAILGIPETRLPHPSTHMPNSGNSDPLMSESTDWKHVATRAPPGAIIGCDYAGTVVEVPSGVAHQRDHIKVGTRVAGWVHGGLFKDRGSFAQYLKVPANLTFPIPDGMKSEEACTFGVPFFTAFHALVHSQRGPWPPAKVGGWILIYGGSSGVGIFTIQLAKLMGYKVVTTCSKRNFELVKGYGADEVFDYNASDAIDNILKVTGGGVHKALDCISEADSQKFAMGCFAPGAGQLNVILAPDADVAATRPDVKIEATLLYTLWGRAFDFGPRGQPAPMPALPHELKFHEELVERIPGFIELGIRAPPIEERGGLADITQGLNDMRDGKLSGKRFVYKIE